MNRMIVIVVASSAMICSAAAVGKPKGIATDSGPEIAARAYTVTGVFSDGSSSSRYFEVSSTADSDGDGLNDNGMLRVECSNGAVAAAAFAPRDTASGMATGRRVHEPLKISKEWEASSAAVGKSVGWNLKESKGARAAADGNVMGMDDWHEASLRTGHPDLCH